MFGFDTLDTELFFRLFSVEHVVYTEGYNSVSWRYVVNDAVMGSFHIEGIGIHECHTSD